MAPNRLPPTRDVITLSDFHRDTAAPPAAMSANGAAAPLSGDAGTDNGGRFDVTRAYDEHGPVIFRFALNAINDRGMAEECVQETFTRAWQARESYDPGQATPRTWLFAIARNVIRDAFRRRARIPVPVDDSHLRNAAAVPDPDESLIMVEALASLSGEHRQAIVAIHLVGVSYAELSAAAGVPVATLRSRTFHGLRALRRHFEKGHTGDD